jgi:aldehyde dehydrogenase (NAD+)
VNVGPLVNRRALDKVHGYTGIGIAEGAKLVTGGRMIDRGGGYFYAPTLFDDVTPSMRVAQEEIFGPTVCVMEADNLAQAITIANGTQFGLSLAIYTQNINNAFVAMRDLKSGLVYVNSPTIGSEIHYPFGGVKATGNGQRENGPSAIEEYSELKTMFVDFSGAMRRNGM